MVFSVKKLGIVCVWVIRFLDKNPDNIGNFVTIFFIGRCTKLAVPPEMHEITDTFPKPRFAG